MGHALIGTTKISRFAENQVQRPAAFSVGVLLAEVVSVVGVPCFLKCVMKGEAAVLPVVESVRKLDHGGGPVVGSRVRTKRVADDVAN